MDSIKNEMDDFKRFDIKHPNRKKKMICPNCGHDVYGKVLNKMLYCERCHKRINNIIIMNNDEPIK